MIGLKVHNPIFTRKNKKKIGPLPVFIPESREQLLVFNYFCEYELANLTFSQALWQGRQPQGAFGASLGISARL
jgi:hypothetical protein